MIQKISDLGEVNLDEIIGRTLDRSRLDRYFELLMDQNRQVNLVSRETSRADFDRLVAESLLPLGQINLPRSNYLDIGAGGGIPAIPIMLSGAVSGETFLVERTLKKARALESIVHGLGLNAVVLPKNFEELHELPPLHLVTLRLVKPDQNLVSKVHDLLAPGGVFIYYSKLAGKASGFTRQAYTYHSAQDPVVKNLTIFKK